MLTDLKWRAKRKRSDDFTGRMTTITTPDGVASEAYRSLRTKFMYARADTRPRVVMVTSPGSREGKSTVCANLGVVLAQASQNTLLVDGDLRDPVLHKMFELDKPIGIVDALIEDKPLQATLRDALPGLKVAPAGALAPNSAELVGSRPFVEFLGWARWEFEYVIVDSPSLGEVSDPLILATQVDGVLLVFDAQSTDKGAVKQAVRSLQTVGANILGTVMNNVKGAGGAN